MSERSSLEAFRLKRDLSMLSSREGRGTELISLYVPPGRQISDAMNNLKNEYGTAANIKSTTTRKHVQDAIVKVMQKLKLFKKTPPTGLVIFCGAIPTGPPGSEEMEIYVIVPPKRIEVYLYRCDSHFYLDPLRDMLKEKETFGMVVIDGSGAMYATLRGKRLDVVRKITSGVPSKHRAGGQSARRFERLREVEIGEFFKRAGAHADEIFLEIPDLKGIILGGPGPTKDDFLNGEYMNYTLKQKVLATVDTAYTDEQGIKEVVDKSSEIIKNVRYVEEKRLMQRFLHEIGHDTGLATYGEKEVRSALQKGSVEVLLLSEGLDVFRVTVSCQRCGFIEKRTMRRHELPKLEKELSSCPKCSASEIKVETNDLIDALADIAEETGASVEIISANTEEGAMLKDSFGGVAAVLRYKQR